MKLLESRPSRLLPWLLSGAHAAAAFSFVHGLGATLWLAPALGLIGVSLFDALRRAREACRLGLEEGGTLLLGPDAAAPRAARPLPGTVVLGGVVWLVWREEEGGRRGARMLLRDQFSASDWRALQVWARLRARVEAGETRR